MNNTKFTNKDKILFLETNKEEIIDKLNILFKDTDVQISSIQYDVKSMISFKTAANSYCIPFKCADTVEKTINNIIKTISKFLEKYLDEYLYELYENDDIEDKMFEMIEDRLTNKYHINVISADVDDKVFIIHHPCFDAYLSYEAEYISLEELCFKKIRTINILIHDIVDKITEDTFFELYKNEVEEKIDLEIEQILNEEFEITETEIKRIEKRFDKIYDYVDQFLFGCIDFHEKNDYNLTYNQRELEIKTNYYSTFLYDGNHVKVKLNKNIYDTHNPIFNNTKEKLRNFFEETKGIELVNWDGAFTGCFNFIYKNCDYEIEYPLKEITEESLKNWTGEIITKMENVLKKIEEEAKEG